MTSVLAINANHNAWKNSDNTECWCAKKYVFPWSSHSLQEIAILRHLNGKYANYKILARMTLVLTTSFLCSMSHEHSDSSVKICINIKWSISKGRVAWMWCSFLGKTNANLVSERYRHRLREIELFTLKQIIICLFLRGSLAFRRSDWTSWRFYCNGNDVAAISQ